MNPIHFQFVTTPPFGNRYSIKRLFELLDDFDVRYRDLILRSAYNCFDLGNHGEYSPKTYREDMYRYFQEAFPKKELQGCAEDDLEWRETYAIYALVSYVLVDALASSQRSDYSSFRYSQKDGLNKYNENIKGDESSRQKAMTWSVYALKTLEQMYFNRLGYGIAYRQFCERVVNPLLTDEEAE